MTWTWRLEAADGSPATGPLSQAVPTHPTQSDAETWLGETWRSLAEEGVEKASLINDGQLVYGPMTLAE